MRVCACALAHGGIGENGAGLALESCAKAVASGDGRDVFALQPSGQLLNVPSKRCASVDEPKEGTRVSLVDCDSASLWEVQSTGQLKLKSVGDFCLTQEGVAPGLRDAAANAAAMASSTLNVLSHGGSCFKFVVINVLFGRSCNGNGRPDEHVLGFEV